MPESMLGMFGVQISENSVFENEGEQNKNHASAELLRRNIGVDGSKAMYSMEDMMRRSQNPNCHSIQDLKPKNSSNIIITGAENKNQAKNSSLRRQIGGPSNASSAIDIKKAGNHATLVVRNQINIINNNQSQQIFSKNNNGLGMISVPIEEFDQNNAYKGSTISNKNKKFLTQAQQSNNKNGNQISEMLSVRPNSNLKSQSIRQDS